MLLDYLPIPILIILAGGTGKYHHLAEGLSDNQVDAVTKVHLFNFAEDGLEKA